MSAADDRLLLSGNFERARERAKARAEAKAAKRARSLSRPARAKGTTKGEKRVNHRTATAILRDAVWERCGGKDEVTGEELGTAWEMHHVESAGLRRTRQHLGNVLAVSWETHRKAHRGELGILELIARAPTLDDAATRAALYRVAKVHEARRTPSVPVKIEVAS